MPASTTSRNTIADRPTGTIDGPAAWYGRDLQHQEGWIELLSPAEVDEVLVAVHRVEGLGLAMLDMSADDFPLPTLAPRLRALAAELDRGRGFWLLRGLPINRLTERQAAFAYWGLGLHMGTPVSQNARGHLLGHVTDEGRDLKDPGTRGYQTRLRLPYHTDSSDVVGLLCLQPAKRGGLSSVASTTSAYNEVVLRRPDLAHLWFREWYYDRRNEERPGEDPYFRTPLASWNDGLLSVRYVRSFLDSAQRHEGVPRRTTEETEFLDLVDEIANEPGFALNMDFRPGDIQFVCNYSTFHSRTAYEDHEGPGRQRHLLRLWLTLHEGRAIPTDFGRGTHPGVSGRGGIAPVPDRAEPLAGTYA
ncbi:MAG: TauD/TfdA family dioxygenase [Acidimicrobiales bacterium]